MTKDAVSRRDRNDSANWRSVRIFWTRRIPPKLHLVSTNVKQPNIEWRLILMISLTKFNLYLLLYIHYSTLHYLLPSMFILYCPFVSIHIQKYISVMSYNSFLGLSLLGGGRIFLGEYCRGKSNYLPVIENFRGSRRSHQYKEDNIILFK